MTHIHETKKYIISHSPYSYLLSNSLSLSRSLSRSLSSIFLIILTLFQHTHNNHNWKPESRRHLIALHSVAWNHWYEHEEKGLIDARQGKLGSPKEMREHAL